MERQGSTDYEMNVKQQISRGKQAHTFTSTGALGTLNPCQLKDRLTLFFDATPETVTEIHDPPGTQQLAAHVNSGILHLATEN